MTGGGESRFDERIVSNEDQGIRLDRWFRIHFPGLPHGALSRLLRRGEIRLDGVRTQTGTRMVNGQSVRIPKRLVVEQQTAQTSKAMPARVDHQTAKLLQSRILYRDDDFLVINKPYGLAVQGGTGQRNHVDGALAGLAIRDEIPRLVHRIDRHTTGVLVLALHVAAARLFGVWMRQNQIDKRYWALVDGHPTAHQGEIDLALLRRNAMDGRERMVLAARPWHDDGARESPDTDRQHLTARTRYRVIAQCHDVGHKRSWLELTPLTGRTHQIRVHCASLGTPIIGDSRYGQAGPHLHLHARALKLPRQTGVPLWVRAPLPDHIKQSFRKCGFDCDDGSETA